MSELPPEIEQADAMLARAASLDLQGAEHVHAWLLDTTEPAQIALLARAASQLTRSMRQSLALLARLRADRAKAGREAAQHAAWLKTQASQPDAEAWPEPDATELARAERTDDIQTGVVRVIARVADGDRARETALVHRFDRELDDWCDEPDFLDHDVDAVIRHACRVLGLPQDLAARWRDLPDPEWTPDPAPGVAHPDPDRVINWPPHPDIIAEDAIEDVVAEDDDPAHAPRADSG